MASEAEFEPPSSVLGVRLAIESSDRLPSISSLGLGEAKKQAFEWQDQRIRAKWNDLSGTTTGRLGARWVTETHAIVGVVAEQVLLAIELEVEKELVRRAIRDLPDSDLEHKGACLAHYSRSLRFFAESQANAVVIALHGLVNAAVRSLEFDKDLTLGELRKLKVTREDFKPGSEVRAAWLSWAPSTIEVMASISSSRSEAMQAMVAELGDIAREQAIEQLIHLRNTQYHRWRGESAGVTGIALGEPTAADLLESGQAVGLGRELLNPYKEGEKNLQEIVEVSRAGLDAFVQHMSAFLTEWRATLPH